MSQLVDVRRCLTLGCQGITANPSPHPRSRDRFCTTCLWKSANGIPLRRMCLGCKKTIDYENTSVLYCVLCGVERRRQYHRNYWQKIRRVNHCVWCGRQCRLRYCTEYCRWINNLKNNNPYKFTKILGLV